MTLLDTSTAATTAATTAAPSASSAPATVPPVALTGEFGPFDQSLHSAFIGHGALAISVAVAKDGELVHTAAFGVANPMTGEAVSPAHRFRVASNSKLLTATAVLELVEDGKLGLDEPVLGPLVSRLGDRPILISAITLRQLLSHTSGFPEYQRTFFGGRPRTVWRRHGADSAVRCSDRPGPSTATAT